MFVRTLRARKPLERLSSPFMESFTLIPGWFNAILYLKLSLGWLRFLDHSFPFSMQSLDAKGAVNSFQ